MWPKYQGQNSQGGGKSPEGHFNLSGAAFLPLSYFLELPCPRAGSPTLRFTTDSLDVIQRKGGKVYTTGQWGVDSYHVNLKRWNTSVIVSCERLFWL